MIENSIKTLWSKGKPVLNGWLSIPSGFSAEIVASQGYDSVTIDMQHGMIEFGDCLTMLQAMAASRTTPLVRVPWLEPGIVMKVLDAGAYGVICPMVNTREQAERLVSYLRYPPDGNRSFGPTRALFSAGSDYASAANSQVICLAMIETAEAMENLDEIVATPGLDGVYIGPADLTLGVTNGRLPPGFDRQEDEMIETIKRILSAAHGAGIRAVLHCGSPDYAARALGWGFDMVTLLNDARMLSNAAQQSVSKTRELLGNANAQGGGDTGY
ncbi:MAG: aldolase/citrate lyase family protein [Pseudomonadota bacterium]